MATLASVEQINKLKRELGPRLLSSEQVQPPPGVPTGWNKLDRFLLWHGFPKSSVSLMLTEAGGATSLWLRSAALVTGHGQWAAWVNDSATSLTAWSLRARGVDLSRFLYVSPPHDERQRLWVLQELMSLSLFELIGCDLGEWAPKDHHILKLKSQASRFQTSLVLFSRKTPQRLSSFYSLVLHFQKKEVCVIRALHRPTPTTLERSDLYADTLPLLAAGRRALCR